jgi:hypothetical protein
MKAKDKKAGASLRVNLEETSRTLAGTGRVGLKATSQS